MHRDGECAFWYIDMSAEGLSGQIWLLYSAALVSLSMVDVTGLCSSTDTAMA